MTLTLTIENETSLPNGAPVSVKVTDKRNLDIGRGAHLDWTLPDPSRFISGKHCEVRYRDEAYWLYDVSTNGTFLNDNSRRIHTPHKLCDGDRLAIGSYIIAVTIEDDPLKPDFDDRPEIAAEERPAEAPISEAPAGEEPVLSEPAPETPAGADESPETHPHEAHAAESHAATESVQPLLESNQPDEAEVSALSSISEDEAPTGSALFEQAALTPHGANPFAAATVPGSEASDEELLAAAYAESAAVEALHPFAAEDPFVVPPAAPVSGKYSPETGFAALPHVSGTPLHFEQAAPFLEPALIEEMTPRLPKAETPVAPVSIAATEAKSDVSLDEFMARFAAAAGIPAQIFDRQDKLKTAEDLGYLMLFVVSSMKQLLSARDSAKRFARTSNRTVVQAFDNNPLKFAPTPEDALKIMFGPKTSGYLDARRALESSFGDLKTHQIKTFSAMQNAVKMLVEDLDPQEIDASMEPDKGLSALLSSRKARLWDLYLARWQAKTLRHDDGLVDAFMLYFSECYDRTGD
jgi:type VI secretion system protein ImpI